MGALIGALLAGAGAAGSAPTKSQLDPLASSKARARARGQLRGLAHPVRLAVFTSPSGDAQLNAAELALAKGLAELSPNVSVEAYGLESEEARACGVDKAPAVAILFGEGARIRFFGVPGGHEFDAWVAAIGRAAARDSGLTEVSRRALASLAKPVRVQVFVTLDCEYCPEMADLANRLAIESDKVTSDIIDISVFPDLPDAARVKAVPTLVVNGATAIVGRRSEEDLVAAVVQAAGVPSEPRP